MLGWPRDLDADARQTIYDHLFLGISWRKPNTAQHANWRCLFSGTNQFYSLIEGHSNILSPHLGPITDKYNPEGCEKGKMENMVHNLWEFMTDTPQSDAKLRFKCSPFRKAAGRQRAVLITNKWGRLL